LVKSLFGLANSERQRGKKGAEGTGKNLTDKGKPGTKRHLVVERKGIPLALKCTGANVADTTTLQEMVDAIPPLKSRRGRPRKRPDKMHADKGYDSKANRAALRKRVCVSEVSYRVSPGVASRAIRSWDGTAGW